MPVFDIGQDDGPASLAQQVDVVGNDGALGVATRLIAPGDQQLFGFAGFG
jgi:hypothetical protein